MLAAAKPTGGKIETARGTKLQVKSVAIDEQPVVAVWFLSAPGGNTVGSGSRACAGWGGLPWPVVRIRSNT